MTPRPRYSVEANVGYLHARRYRNGGGYGPRYLAGLGEDHQAVAVDTQALERNGPFADIAAKALELLTLMVFAGDGGVQ